MFYPLAICIGLRYTRAKRRNHFISFISLMSMLGIALGIVTLITVLSVMNGFDEVIRSQIFSLAPQLTINTVTDAPLTAWQAVAKQVKNIDGVQAVAPYIGGQGLLVNRGEVVPGMISAIDPNEEINISAIGESMVTGYLGALKSGSFGIVLGAGLADSLGLTIGDKVMLMTPQATITPVGIIPRFKRFNVVGIFNVNDGFGFNDHLAYINLQDGQSLFNMDAAVTGLHLKLFDPYQAPRLSKEITTKLPEMYRISNWTEEYGAFFKAIQLEKTMMFIVLLLIVAVAIFNLVSTLVMVVVDKQADIAILRTFGATPRMIMAIFMVQGAVIGLFGTFLGVIGGLALASHITQLVNALQNLLGIQFLSSGVYYVNYLPSKIEISDIWHISVVSLVLSILATFYPAFRASCTQPAEALRYE